MNEHLPACPSPPPDHEAVVIGAGLAAGYYLSQAGVGHLILEPAEAVGDSWPRRWESLRLFTPARYDSLPGMDFLAAPGYYPDKGEVTAYLAAYAVTFGLPVRTRTRMHRLEAAEAGFRLHLDDGQSLTAEKVIVATGAFGAPYRPALAADLAPSLPQLHTHDHHTSDDLPVGTVLVVGGGNSGVQLAEELAHAGRQVHLAERTRPRHIRQRIAGRDLFWWAQCHRGHPRPAHHPIGRRLQADAVIGTSCTQLLRAGVRFRPAATAAHGRTMAFADGSALAPEAVLWATGYRHDDHWIAVPGALDPSGTLITDQGRTPIPGLYALGRPWQRDRGSALLGFVSTDARCLAERITT